ncbi:MAG: hypothetical protein FD180_4010 [Planctomycetota bacterium]|nr:MAG: hypothetical protein FD180_4010 [Planctomycetota bacterium]
MREIPDNLPGADLVKKGIQDLQEGRLTVESLLVSVGARRIRESGVEVPPGLATPEERLYELVAGSHGDDAHSQYNALIRRLISFEQALECASR